MFVVTLSVLILATIWCKSRHSNSSNGAPSLPPGPYSLPIVGYIPFLSPNLHTQFTNMAHTYGPIFKLKLGSKLYVVINTPELAKEVVRDQDEVFSNRDQQAAAFVLSNGGQDIAFSDNNASWRKLRKILVHETLSNKNLEASSSFRRDEVRKTVKNVFGKIGTQVGIFEIALSTVTNVLMRTIWENASYSGVKNENLAAEINVAAYNIITILGRMNLSDFFPSLARFDIQGVVHDMKKQCNKLDQLLTNIIEDRIESNLNKSQNKAGHEGKKDFLEFLLNYKDEKDGTPLDMLQIKALLMNTMVAGTLSTATAVEWAMASIMHNHNIMRNIQKELEEHVKLNNMVQEYHLPKLQYLDAIIKETLRMYPIGPFLLPRSPSKACMVGGYTIPKGCTILLNVWSIHRDPLYWDKPLEFDPERFLTNKWDYKENNLMYFPFGSGRRQCPGVSLADKILRLILASLLHSFDWSMPMGEVHDFTEKFGLALEKKQSLIAIPSPRLSDANLYM